jgi:hypothetical protein
MKIRIEDGKTIISTGVGNDAVRNKTGVRGLSYRESLNCYTLAIVVDGRKYHIGNYDTVEEGKAMRKIADEMIANGTFHDWHKNLRMKRKERTGSRRFKQNKSEGMDQE